MLDRPALVDRMHGAPGEVFRSASEEERAAAEAWIAERRAAAHERKREKRARTHRIASLAHGGATIAEIAEAVGGSPRSIERACATIGLRLGHASSHRRLIATPIGADLVAAFDRLAADYGAARDATLAVMLRYLLDDDAFIARRVLRIAQTARQQSPEGTA
jgi:hypothetical protein